MAGFSIYLAERDEEVLLNWLNAEPVVWIISESKSEGQFSWRAVETIESLVPGEYCLWHPETSPLFIPSGNVEVEDTLVLDPFKGWKQSHEKLDSARQVPWFGSGHTGTYSLDYRLKGSETNDSIARSHVGWVGDYWRILGRPAHPIAKKWYNRFFRFVKKQSIGIPWPPDIEQLGVEKTGAYAFPRAYTMFAEGKHLDANTTYGPYA